MGGIPLGCVYET